MFLFVGVLVAGILLPVAFWQGRPLYRSVLGHRLLHSAEKAASDHHPGEARRFYILALQRLPGDPDTLRSFAAFLDRIFDGEVLRLRAALSEESPGDPEALLDYAEAALRYGNRRLAVNLLFHQPPPALLAKARYYHLASVIHFVSGELAEAEAANAEAIARDPKNVIYQANRATIELSSTDPAVRDAAVATLEGFLANPDAKPTALQALARYSCKAPEEPAHFEKWMADFRAVVAPSNPIFTTYLDALRRWRSDRWTVELAGFTEQARKNRTMADYAQNWLADSRDFPNLADFRASLPAEWQQSETSLMCGAKALFDLKKLDEFKALLGEPGWKSMPAVKLAWQERLRRIGREDADDQGTGMLKWEKALDVADRNPQQLFALVGLAADWHWLEEYPAALWVISDDALVGSDSALRELFHFYVTRSDARGLLRVADRQYSQTPQNPLVASNLAFLSFLLEANQSKADRIAGDLCAKYPGNLNFIATQAFGLFKAGKTAKGLALFQGVDPSMLVGTQPGVCYGYLLAASHDPEAARFLEGAEKWLTLPEEKQLLKSARDSVELAQK